MSSQIVLQTIAIGVVLAGAETLHGIARTVWVVPRLGKAHALALGAVTGSLLAFAICFLLVPGIGLTGLGSHLWLGLVLAAFMAVFDIAMGKLVLRRPWHKIWPDFNPATGNYLLLALVVLALSPALVALCRGRV